VVIALAAEITGGKKSLGVGSAMEERPFRAG